VSVIDATGAAARADVWIDWEPTRIGSANQVWWWVGVRLWPRAHPPRILRTGAVNMLSISPRILSFF